MTSLPFSRKSRSTHLERQRFIRFIPLVNASHTQVTTTRFTPSQVILTGVEVSTCHGRHFPFSSFSFFCSTSHGRHFLFFFFHLCASRLLNIKICLYIRSNATIEECVLEVLSFYYPSLTPPI